MIVGAPYILFCLGRLDRIHYLFIYGRIQSPITWDVIAIMTDLVFCAAFLYFTHIRDFAKLRDIKGLNVSKWRMKLYKVLALNYKGTPLQKKYLHQAHDIMAAIIIPTAVIAYSLLSWLFGMSLKPGWQSGAVDWDYIFAAKLLPPTKARSLQNQNWEMGQYFISLCLFCRVKRLKKIRGVR